MRALLRGALDPWPHEPPCDCAAQVVSKRNKALEKQHARLEDARGNMADGEVQTEPDAMLLAAEAAAAAAAEALREAQEAAQRDAAAARGAKVTVVAVPFTDIESNALVAREGLNLLSDLRHKTLWTVEGSNAHLMLLAVWKSTSRRPTPSTRRCPRDCICSMAWRSTEVSRNNLAHWSSRTQVIGST